MYHLLGRNRHHPEHLVKGKVREGVEIRLGYVRARVGSRVRARVRACARVRVRARVGHGLGLGYGRVRAHLLDGCDLDLVKHLRDVLVILLLLGVRVRLGLR